MVRGYQKRIIHLKNTESDAFDEAFFLVSEDGRAMCEQELVAEANRIIAECSSGSTHTGNIRARLMRMLSLSLAFLIGAALGVTTVIMLTIV